MIPIDEHRPVYDAMLSRIGALSQRQIQAVLAACGRIILAPKCLSMFGKRHHDNFSSWMEVDVKYAGVIDNMHKEHVRVLDIAIRALETARSDKYRT